MTITWIQLISSLNLQTGDTGLATVIKTASTVMIYLFPLNQNIVINILERIHHTMFLYSNYDSLEIIPVLYLFH